MRTTGKMDWMQIISPLPAWQLSADVIYGIFQHRSFNQLMSWKHRSMIAVYLSVPKFIIFITTCILTLRRFFLSLNWWLQAYSANGFRLHQNPVQVNPSPPGQNCHHFADDSFRSIFVIYFVLWLKFNWILFLRAHLTVTQHWLR